MGCSSSTVHTGITHADDLRHLKHDNQRIVSVDEEESRDRSTSGSDCSACSDGVKIDLQGKEVDTRLEIEDLGKLRLISESKDVSATMEATTFQGVTVAPTFLICAYGTKVPFLDSPCSSTLMNRRRKRAAPDNSFCFPGQICSSIQKALL